jgi:hypothetical protein
MYHGRGLRPPLDMHPYIHAELARAKTDDIDRRVNAARLDRPPTPIRARRRPLRTAARRLVVGLARPARSAP